MRAKPGLQQTLIVWAAAYVLALNAIIGSFAGAAAYAALDPALAGICHNSDGGPQPNAPKRVADCNHCVLCQAPSSGALPPVVAAVLEPLASDTRHLSDPSDLYAQRPLSSGQARAPPSRA